MFDSLSSPGFRFNRGLGTQRSRMTFGTRILEGMTRQTSARIEHGQGGMSASRENRQRSVAPWQLVVAADAVIRLMAGSAGGAIEGGIFSVQIVLPARSV